MVRKRFASQHHHHHYHHPHHPHPPCILVDYKQKYGREGLKAVWQCGEWFSFCKVVAYLCGQLLLIDMRGRPGQWCGTLSSAPTRSSAVKLSSQPSKQKQRKRRIFLMGLDTPTVSLILGLKDNTRGRGHLEASVRQSDQAKKEASRPKYKWIRPVCM